jgi:prevent-host-death family protein
MDDPDGTGRTFEVGDRAVSASVFKAECLRLIDEVADTGQALVVTKRGKPVARVVPLEPPRPLARSVTYLVDDEALVAPIGSKWEAAEA